jgi:hypothetical protein
MRKAAKLCQTKEMTMIKETISLPRHGLQLDDADGQCAAYLKQINGKAEKYAYQVGDLVRVALGLEEALESAGIARSKRPGITAVVRSSGPDRSRKTASWTPQGMGTVAHLRRYDTGWRLMMADRVTVYAGQAEHRKIVIQRKEYEAIKARAVADFEAAR